MIIESRSEKDTFEFARGLGEAARPGEVYCLDGDLGAGKTVFAKGFAVGLGITEPVTSPTFTLLREYDEGRLKLYHFDIYRIADPDELTAIGCEEYLYGDGVCLVEWAELAQELMPEDAVHISINREPENGDDYRCIRMSRDPDIAD